MAAATMRGCTAEPEEIAMTMNNIHEKHWAEFMADGHQRTLYDSWWTTESVGYWRQTRLMAVVNELLVGFRKHSWLTIGDGAGYDAWRMKQAGFEDVLATDLDDTVLAQTKASGHIDKFSIENAEKLSLPDNSVDFVLCKEALHHMSRPYAAIYEMFRVARYCVVVVEPQDAWVDHPCALDETRPHYESVGNFVYSFSNRELEKIAYALNIRGIASRKMMDAYIPGCETATCVDGDAIWEATRHQVDDLTRKLQAGHVTASYVQAALFKHTVAPELFELLQQQNPDWRFRRTDTNPHLAGRPAF
jgi:ubiquinone/menaquinone biosynthesis C-methylase UbiE